uniref:Uncharacterized protein n=1 Tax=Ditylenchus dipsaci TaxID=166011 RepID=A0A915DFK0_9BILA
MTNENPWSLFSLLYSNRYDGKSLIKSTITYACIDLHGLLNVMILIIENRNSLSKSAGSSTAFRSSFEEAFDLAMSRIDISNPLKEPICLLASKVDSMGKQLNRKIDDLDTKMEKVLLLSAICKKTMQKRLNREFQQNVKFECTFEGIMGMRNWIFSRRTHRRAQLTKRDFIAKQYGLTGSSIAAYIMCMRIDEDMKAELQELAKEDNIVIYINDDA